MTLRIEHYPDTKISLGGFFPAYTVDIQNSVKARIHRTETITGEFVCTILRQIQRESDIMVFLTRPVVSISLSAVVLLIGIAIPIYGVSPVIGVIAIIVVKFFIEGVSGFCLVYAIGGCMTGLLSRISATYRCQSTKVSEYIRYIEASRQEIVFVYEE